MVEMTVLKQVQFIKEEDNKIFQLLLRREFCQSRDTCLLQGDFFFFFLLQGDLIRVRGHNIF